MTIKEKIQEMRDHLDERIADTYEMAELELAEYVLDELEELERMIKKGER